VTNGIFPTNDADEHPIWTAIEKVNWTSFVVGLTSGLVTLHLITTRPLLKQIEGLQDRISSVQADVETIAGAEDDIRKTNGLLNAIARQNEQLEAARASIASLEQLQRDVRTQARLASQAHEELTALTDLNQRLINTVALQSEVKSVLDEIRSVHDDAAALGVEAEQLAASMGGADAALKEVANLQQRILNAADQVDEADAALAGMTNLQSNVIATEANTNEANAKLNGMLALQNTLAKASNLDTAHANTDRLLELQTRIATDERLQLGDAEESLERLAVLQQSIASQSQQLGDGIDALELVTEFHGELYDQVAQMQDLRRQLTELILLEATVGRAIETLRPLAELSSLRRIDSEEIRSMARTILDERHGRMATAESKYDQTSEEEVIDRPVPTPPADEEIVE